MAASVVSSVALATSSQIAGAALVFHLQPAPHPMLPTLFRIDATAPQTKGLLEAMVAEGGEKLLAAVAVPSRIFGLTSPWAPGLSFVGAEVPLWPATAPGPADLISAGGVGLSLGAALVSCLGESIERVSQAAREGDVAFRGSLADAGGRVDPNVVELANVVAALNGTDRGTPIDWIGGRSWASAREVLLPADWVLRRSAAGPLRMTNTPLSTGVAAGPTLEDARTRAILELIERDAIAQWWIGGRRGRPIPLEAAGEAAALVATAQAGAHCRATWLLDVTTDIDVPCLVSLSVGADGRGLACGMAARSGFALAARAAILEMCQMELALLVVELKRQERGDDALNAVDRQHVLRATTIDANDCDLLHPAGAPRIGTERPSPVATPVERLAAVTEVAFVDLTRPDYGVPVVAAIAPALQRFPSDVATARLTQAMASFGGGARWTRGVPLG